MNLRPVAAILLPVVFFFGAAGVPARAQDDPPLSTNCQRAGFLKDVADQSGSQVVINDYIENMAQQLCDSRPDTEPPPLRIIGDTYTVRPGNPCQYDDQHPACIADHIEKVLYFRNRSPACRAEFSENAQAGKPEVTCPVAGDTQTSQATGSSQGGFWEAAKGWGLFILIIIGGGVLWSSVSGGGRSSGPDSGEPYQSPGPDGIGWKRP
jgi:hypothetical protein